MIEASFWIAFAGIAALLALIIGCLAVLAWSPGQKEHGICWACGQAGENLYWHAVDEDRTRGEQCNQRVSYLIHPACVWLAEKQAGL